MEFYQCGRCHNDYLGIAIQKRRSTAAKLHVARVACAAECNWTMICAFLNQCCFSEAVLGVCCWQPLRRQEQVWTGCLRMHSLHTQHNIYSHARGVSRAKQCQCDAGSCDAAHATHDTMTPCDTVLSGVAVGAYISDVSHSRRICPLRCINYITPHRPQCLH